MVLSLSETAVVIALALRNRDVRAMRKVNDKCIDECAIKFERPTYLFALISYVLSKILSKPRYFTQGRSKSSLAIVETQLRSCERFAREADYDALLSSQDRILSTIEKMDDADRRFVKGILMKGKLKIASVLYAQGISLGNASELTGSDKREVLLYAGQTMMFDRLKEKRGIEERLKELREIFS
ncbi:Uncharacterised protein [uncultured archaeon]|nr:Uncharacterised protein [uncultured archaeon]